MAQHARARIADKGWRLPRDLRKSAMSEKTSMSGGGCAIDLQKMNWKMRAGLAEQTGVSLKERLANNTIRGYTHAYQDTAESRNRQRPPQPSAARLSAR